MVPKWVSRGGCENWRRMGVRRSVDPLYAWMKAMMGAMLFGVIPQAFMAMGAHRER